MFNSIINQFFSIDHQIEMKDVKKYGNLKGFVKGTFSVESQDCQAVFLTVHDVGDSSKSMKDLAGSEGFKGIASKSVFIHAMLPGQSEDEEEPLAAFPTIQELVNDLAGVLDEFNVKAAILLGVGAGTNIALRFALFNPDRCNGLILIRPSNIAATPNKKVKETFKRLSLSSAPNNDKIPLVNVEKYKKSFLNRKDISHAIKLGLECDVLIVVGSSEKKVEIARKIFSFLGPTLPKNSLVEIRGESKGHIEKEQPSKVAQAVLHFCQGLGFLPTVLTSLVDDWRVCVCYRMITVCYYKPDIYNSITITICCHPLSFFPFAVSPLFYAHPSHYIITSSYVVSQCFLQNTTKILFKLPNFVQNAKFRTKLQF